MLPPNFKSLENTTQQHINHFHPFPKSAPPTALNWWLAETFSHFRAGSHPSRYTWEQNSHLLFFAHKTLCDSFQSHPIRQLQVAKWHQRPVKNWLKICSSHFAGREFDSIHSYLRNGRWKTLSLQLQLWRPMGPTNRERSDRSIVMIPSNGVSNLRRSGSFHKCPGKSLLTPNRNPHKNGTIWLISLC